MIERFVNYAVDGRQEHRQQSLKLKEVGIGSSAQDLKFPDRISLETFSIETLANYLSGSNFSSNLDGVVGCSSSSILLRIFSKSFLVFAILLEKYCPNLFAKSLPNGDLGNASLFDNMKPNYLDLVVD